MTDKKFISKYIIGHIKKLQDSDFHYFSFLIMVQAIELLGAFLDKKPFRAVLQTKKRFSLAINTLFPQKYRKLNRNDRLYQKLRNNLAHLLIPGTDIILATSSNPLYIGKHLSFENDKLVLLAEDFYNDVKKAAEKLILLIESGKVHRKMIEFNMFISS